MSQTKISSFLHSLLTLDHKHRSYDGHTVVRDNCHRQRKCVYGGLASVVILAFMYEHNYVHIHSDTNSRVNATHLPYVK